jgi:hypothetical protein
VRWSEVHRGAATAGRDLPARASRRGRAAGEELPERGDLSGPEEKLLRRQEGDFQAGAAPPPLAGEQQTLPWPQPACRLGQAVSRITGRHQPPDSGLLRLFNLLAQTPGVGQGAEGQPEGRLPLVFHEGREQRRLAAARPAPDLHERRVQRREAGGQALRLRKKVRRLDQTGFQKGLNGVWPEPDPAHRPR